MISVAEALQLIDENSSKAEPEQLALNEASGLVLAKDIYSPADIPAYPQSSMDGYALSYLGWKKGSALQLSGEMAAGSSFSIPLLPNHAIRIFTGAAVPAGADTVVIQEKSKIINGKLIIEDENLIQNQSSALLLRAMNYRLRDSHFNTVRFMRPILFLWPRHWNNTNAFRY